MLEMLFPIPVPIQTFAPPAAVHALSWQNSTVEEVYFMPTKAGKKIDARLDNTSKEPVKVRPSVDNSSVILNRLRTFKGWAKNWDGEGAIAPNLAAIETASNFLSLWAPQKVKPEITLTHDGLPMFVIANPRLFGEIIVNSDSTVDYFFEPESGQPFGEESVQYKSKTMLKILKELT
jgi:hypothetical protein